MDVNQGIGRHRDDAGSHALPDGTVPMVPAAREAAVLYHGYSYPVCLARAEFDVPPTTGTGIEDRIGDTESGGLGQCIQPDAVIGSSPGIEGDIDQIRRWFSTETTSPLTSNRPVSVPVRS